MCRKERERIQREQKHFSKEVEDMKRVREELRQTKRQTARNYHYWLARRNEFALETAQEKRQAEEARRHRGEQVKGLLSALNREARLQHEEELRQPQQQQTGCCCSLQPPPSAAAAAANWLLLQSAAASVSSCSSRSSCCSIAQ
ncbi:hypothetical protein, conserved [Eimeria tenella]|uniref:Trichohyalin n=1 Tax=Eimeria tenella TaxID=5802 RepID=U6L7N7_EIMTE|nr:hypothetical protein, conserved [Eimeria tenella]CDJ45228.1 hypothetical protein, conserved [Eimeria tenella]|eukprot:XP_013235975.1 hypothetical protein, conserved [Eimeria tenella]